MQDCPYCGRPIIDGTIFCLDCGAKIIKEEPANGNRKLDERPELAANRDVEVDSMSPGSYIFVVQGVDRGLSFALARDKVTAIGRDDAEIRLKDPFTSRQHAQIRPDGDSFWLHDMKSANCTLVNSRPVDRHELRDGDLIELGYTNLLFRVKT